MPRVHYVAKARKDNPVAKKGEPYYYWAFFRGRKQFSATRPRQSQLTQSKWSDIYAAQENVEDAEDLDTLLAALQDAAQACEDAAGEYEEADEAMGGHYGPNMERAEHLQELQSGLEDVQSSVEDAQSAAETAADEAAEAAKADDSDAPEADDSDDSESAADAFERLQEEALSLDWDSPC